LEALTELEQRISEFQPRDVFSFDEESLFYKLESNKPLGTKQVTGRKS